MVDSGSVTDIDLPQAPTTFWYIIVLVLLAPVQLSRHIQSIVSSNDDDNFFKNLASVQFVLVLPTIVPVLYLTTDKQTLFKYGAVVGVTIILLLPMLYINIVRRMIDGRKKTVGVIKESFFRGVSRVWVFYLIGGLLGILIGRPEWALTEYICSLGLGFASANAMSLMLVMSQIDVMGYNQIQDILLEAHTARKLKPLLFGAISVLFFISHCLPFWAGLEITLSYPSLASILAVAFAGLSIGSRYSLGWLVGTVSSLLTNSKTVLRHDELGVIMYWRLNNYLEVLRNQESPLPYYKEVAYFLPWSPWKEIILKGFVDWLTEDTRNEIDRVDKMLDLPLPDLIVLVDNLNKVTADNPDDGAVYIILKRILDTLSSGTSYIDLKLAVKNRQPLPETFRSWFRLLPQRFTTQKIWSAKFEQKLTEVGGECDLASVLLSVESSRPVINTILARYIRKQAEIYFQPPLEITLVVEWKQTTCFLRDRKTAIEVDIINASQIPIKLHELTISLVPKVLPVWITTTGREHQKTWECQPDSTLEPGSTYTITLPILCEREQIEAGLALEISYAFRKEGGRDAGYHESKVVRSHKCLLLNERPFVTITPNPYNRYPVKSADRLFGRENEVNRLCALLSATPCEADVVSITGERRIGKTSLLYVVESQLNNSGVAAVYCDAQRFSLGRDTTEGDGITGMLLWLANAYAKKFGRSKTTESLSFNDFILKFSDRRVVFLVDEFDAYMQQLNSAEMKFWESKPFHETTVSIVCSIPESALRAQSADWFNNFFGMHSFSLRSLGNKAVYDLITKPLGGLLDFEPGAITTIMRYTGGFPIYLQALCGALVDYMNMKANSTVVTCKEIEYCLSEESESFSRLMASYIRTLPEKEIEVLNNLAQNNNRLSLEELSGRLTVGVINNMKQRGLIQESGEFISCTAELLLSQGLLNLRSIA